MVALAWTCLNIVLLVLIIYAWVRVFKVLRREIGVGLALLFLLSLTAFRGSQPEGTRQAKNLLSSDEASKAMGNWSTSATVPLNVNNTLHLRVVALRTDSTLQALGLYTTMSGIMLGHEWKPLAGIVNTSNTGLTYQIHLLHEWKLLGAGIYTTSEEYAGRLNYIY